MSEKDVFIQNVSEEELEAVAGGEDQRNCYTHWTRDIYDPSFPNCAATVEDGSYCSTNDACFAEAVVYFGMHECVNAWK